MEGGLRLVSGDPNEIISNNQTLTDVLTRKPINIDNAYITFRPGKSFGLEKPFLAVTGGKFSVNFFRPRAVMVSEMVFDEDLTPEGLTEDVTLFDVYRGAQVPPGKKSVAVGLTLRAGDRTLTDAEADALIASVKDRLKTSLAAEIRS